MTATARLEARLPREALDLVKQAAALQGRTLTDFVVATVHAEASRVLEQNAVIRLNAEESLRFAEAILNPKPPTEAMKRAFEHHRRLIRST